MGEGVFEFSAPGSATDIYGDGHASPPNPAADTQHKKSGARMGIERKPLGQTDTTMANTGKFGRPLDLIAGY